MDISTYRGRGPNVPDNVVDLIAKVYFEDPNQTAKEVMAEVHRRLQEEPPYVQLRPGWPGLSYIQKALIDIRKAESDLSPDLEDRPWSVTALADYDIPYEALPTVMKVWAKALEQDKALTIRQVKWIAYLYHILKDEDIDLLAERALRYANEEKAIKVTGTYPDKPQDSWWLWFSDAILYFNMTGDDIPLKKCIKHMKWQTTTDIAELKLIIKRLFAISLNDDAFKREGK